MANILYFSDNKGREISEGLVIHIVFCWSFFYFVSLSSDTYSQVYAK